MIHAGARHDAAAPRRPVIGHPGHAALSALAAARLPSAASSLRAGKNARPLQEAERILEAPAAPESRSLWSAFEVVGAREPRPREGGPLRAGMIAFVGEEAARRKAGASTRPSGIRARCSRLSTPAAPQDGLRGRLPGRRTVRAALGRPGAAAFRQGDYSELELHLPVPGSDLAGRPGNALQEHRGPGRARRHPPPHRYSRKKDHAQGAPSGRRGDLPGYAKRHHPHRGQRIGRRRRCVRGLVAGWRSCSSRCARA